MEESALLNAIADQPAELTIQLAYADWLAERSRPEEASWRWIAAFKRRPCPFRLYKIDAEPYYAIAGQKYLLEGQLCGGRGWGNWQIWEEHWPWSAGMSMLPDPLYRYLPKTRNPFDGGYQDERAYNSTREAFEALVSAYIKATRPRTSRLDRFWNGPGWQPNWDLVERVPNE